LGSWTAEEEENNREDLDVGPAMVEFDDLPEDPENMGPKHCKRLKETEAISGLLLSMGWTEPVRFDFQQPNFQPDRNFLGSIWEREVDRKKQEILDRKMNTILLIKLVGLKDQTR
jgi:hypothetical protein